jgi:tetratricopeptide (TPR) repeat protein
MNRVIKIILISLVLSGVVLAQEKKTEEKNYESVVTVSAYDKNDKVITQGTGFIATSDGAIVTNLHLLNKAVKIKVKTTKDKYLDVEGVHKVYDLVILKVKGANLPAVNLADSDKITLAKKVYIINKTKNAKNSAIKGMLMGFAEFVQGQKVFSIIEITSSGNGGEPVFDENGCVFGVATFYLSVKDNKLILAMPINVIKDKISETAVKPLKEALSVDYCASPEYLLWLGFCSCSTGDVNKGISNFKEAIRIKPDFAEGHRALGYAYTKLQDYKKAILSFNEAIRIKPDYPLALSGLAYVYARLQDYEKAIELYKECISIDPNRADVYFSMGNTYYKIKDLQNAMNSWKEAVRVNPDFAEAHEVLGDMYLAQYTMLLEDEKCIWAFKEAVRIEPDSVEAHFCLGSAYLVARDIDNASKEYNILKKLNPSMADKLLELINQRKAMQEKGGKRPEKEK